MCILYETCHKHYLPPKNETMHQVFDVKKNVNVNVEENVCVQTCESGLNVNQINLVSEADKRPSHFLFSNLHLTHSSKLQQTLVVKTIAKTEMMTVSTEERKK